MPNIKNKEYEKDGAFMHFLTQTDQKEVSTNYILSKLKQKFNFKDYDKFIFTDIGAGEGTLTLPIIKFLKNKVALTTYCIEPSELMDVLKMKCGPKVIYIKNGMEETTLPNSDFILMAHSSNYIKNKPEFAKRLYSSLNKGGKILIIGTKSDSDDMKLRRGLRSSEEKKKRESIYDLFEKLGLKVSVEFEKSTINLESTLKPNEVGKGIISFYYHIPFSELKKADIEKFHLIAKKLAPDNVLIKYLKFTWVEKD